MAEGLEPENIDKEFLRLWFKDRCDPYKDETLPEAPAELVRPFLLTLTGKTCRDVGTSL